VAREGRGRWTLGGRRWTLQGGPWVDAEGVEGQRGVRGAWRVDPHAHPSPREPPEANHMGAARVKPHAPTRP
jgi:hypothetical protein